MVLMTQVHTESFNVGDVLTLGCAFTAALHIFWISKVGHQVPSSLRFNLFQSFWAGIIPMVIAIFIEPFGDKPFTAKAVGGFIALSLGSTALAFFLQIRAQKVLSATVASMIYLLESPFGAFFAFIFLGEILKPTQWVGAFLILVAALGALAADQQTKRA